MDNDIECNETLAAIVITEQLDRREPRAADAASEAAAFGELARGLATGEPAFVSRLVEVARGLCQAGSAGLTTFEPGPGGPRLRSIVHGDISARAHSARCPSLLPGWLERAATPQLVREPAQALAFLRDVRPAISELLVLPLKFGGRKLAAIWVAAHDEVRRFTAREARLLTTLGAFARARLEHQRTGDALREAEGQLTQARTVGDTLLALVSHELRTPLTTLKGDAALLRRHRDAVDPALREELLADMERDAERLQQVVENLLALAQTGRGEPLELEPVLVERVVRQAVAEHHLRYPGHRVEVDVRGLPPVLAREEYLKQVVTNLLANAARHAGIEQAAGVHGTLKHGMAAVSVVDHGPGMAPEGRPGLFEPFQGARRGELLAPGLGIGLAACRRLMEQQHGRSHVGREREGASVTCLLPLAPEPAAE